ncbi:MAG: type III polyketide synthase [bacterium]|jgi:alpha-pyrone synthase
MIEDVTACLAGIGTANPRHWATQEQVVEFMKLVVIGSQPERRQEPLIQLLDRIYSNSGIRERYGVITDFIALNPEEFTFFPQNWELEPFPTTERRMQVYETESVELACQAARKALQQAGVEPADVTHLIFVSCTGFISPGPDILFMQRLGLNSTVERTLIGFMGCCAGFNGIKAADDIIRTHPEAVVVQINLELCTIHFQKKPVPDLYIANCIFADGCSAVVYCAKQNCPNALAEVVCSHTTIAQDSLEQMSWRIGDYGFEMRLRHSVPGYLQYLAPAFLCDLLQRAGVRQQEICGWGIHPGGRKILEALQSALLLGDEDLFSSYQVLARYGNMSSATIFYVLQEELQRNAKDGVLVAMGFGPGLTVEGVVLRREKV